MKRLVIYIILLGLTGCLTSGGGSGGGGAPDAGGGSPVSATGGISGGAGQEGGASGGAGQGAPDQTANTPPLAGGVPAPSQDYDGYLASEIDGQATVCRGAPNSLLLKVEGNLRRVVENEGVLGEEVFEYYGTGRTVRIVDRLGHKSTDVVLQTQTVSTPSGEVQREGYLSVALHLPAENYTPSLDFIDFILLGDWEWRGGDSLFGFTAGRKLFVFPLFYSFPGEISGVMPCHQVDLTLDFPSLP